MGIFDKMSRPVARADVSWAALDERWYQSVPALAGTFAGFGMSPDAAMRVSAVFACTSLIAETLASLPCVLYRRLDGGGKARAREHRLYRTLRRRPNGWQNRFDYFSSQQMHLGLRGNAYSRILDDGQRVELLPMHPDHVTVEQLADERLRYKWWNQRTQEFEPWSQSDVLHVRDLSADGIHGQARAVLAREAIAVAAAGEAFVGGFFKNDATGRLLIKHPSALSSEKRREFREMIQENYAGWQNRSKAMLLTNGVDATELGKQEDSGFIVDPRKFQVADIARFWRVPLFMIGLEEKSTSWGSGVESQKQGFVDFTIKSWADRWAESMGMALLTEEEEEEYFIEFLFADLVRGDLKTRMESYQIGKQIGMWSPNELRAKENEGPREGGDEYQEHAPGAAPNRSAPPSDSDRTAAGPIPVPLLVDAAHRIAAAEIRALERRAAKAGEDPRKWFTWAEHQLQTSQRDYLRKVLTPLVSAYPVDAAALTLATERVTTTGALGIRYGLAAAWTAQRPDEILDILTATLQPVMWRSAA